MNNTNDQGLLQEIEEDLARQRTEKLWKKYGNTVISAALAIVLVTAGISWYKNYKLSSAQQTTGALLEVLSKNKDKPDDLMAALADYAKSNEGKAQAVFALFNEAGLAVDKNDKAKALEIYTAIAADKSVEPLYQQLADLLYVKTDLDTGPAAELDKKLIPLMVPDCAWRHTAKEFAAHLALREGNKEKAKILFGELKAATDAPKSIQARATDIHSWLQKGE